MLYILFKFIHASEIQAAEAMGAKKLEEGDKEMTKDIERLHELPSTFSSSSTH